MFFAVLLDPAEDVVAEHLEAVVVLRGGVAVELGLGGGVHGGAGGVRGGANTDGRVGQGLVLPGDADSVEGGDEVGEGSPGRLEGVLLARLHLPDGQLGQGRGAGEGAQAHGASIHSLDRI